MKQKKILHVVECFAGGVYDFINSITSATPEYEHTILYGKRADGKTDFIKDFSKQVKFIHWKNATREVNIKKDFMAALELNCILSKNKYDKIHLHSSKAGFIGRVIGRIKNQHKKIIYTTHGISFLRKDISKNKHRFYVVLEKLGEILGGEIIACSKSEAEFIRENGITKVKYIYNGVSTSNLETIQSRIVKEKKNLNIVTVGRITAQKNPVQFNKIAENFLEDKNVKFTWIGDGDLRNELKSENIIITGWKNKEEVIEELLQGDIYLSTSLWEGLPLSVLQAMLVGLPLILSDCIGNRDLISNNGYLLKNLDEVDEIKQLLKRKTFNKMKENSKKLLKERFDLSIMCRNYINLYEKK